MRVTKADDDRAAIESLVNVAGSIAWQFLEPNGTTPQDISSWTPRLEICGGIPDAPGAVVYTFSVADGNMARNNGTATITLTLSMAAALALPAGDYAFRFLWFRTSDSECLDRPFWGRWRHKLAR